MLEMDFETKTLKDKIKNSIMKIVILAMDVTILLVRMHFFKNFHEKKDAGSHKTM